MRRALLPFGLCLILAVPGRAALDRWSSGGPVGGVVFALEIDPFDPAIAYAGTRGGLFRSTDHGATWTFAGSGLAEADVYDVETDPETPGTLYALTDEGIQKSLDRGLSWQPASFRGRPLDLAVDPSHPRTLYTASVGTVYKSTDGGATWVPGQGRGLGAFVRSLEVDPLDSRFVYAAAEDGFFRSADGGVSWNPGGEIPRSYDSDIAVDPVHPGVVYLATGDGVFRSPDRGASWSRAGLAAQFIEKVEIDPSAPAALIALADGVYRSTDAGASWSRIDGRLANVFYLCVALGPSASPGWLLGSDDGIYRSTDRGATWFPSSAGLTASLAGDLAVDPHRPGVLFTTAFGLFRSGDGGASWARLPGPSRIQTLAFDPRTAGVVYAIAGSGLWRSRNDGADWEQINAGVAGSAGLEIAPSPPLTMYLMFTPRGLQKSVDGGLHWRPAGPGGAGFPSYRLAFAPSAPKTLYAVGLDAGVWRSDDAGATWRRADAGLPSNRLQALAVDPRDADVAYAGFEAERVFKTTDGGASWVPSAAGFSFQNVYAMAVDPADSGRVYAYRAPRGIFRSTDGGASWAPFDEGMLPGLHVEEIVLDPVNPFLLYAATLGSGVKARADLAPGPRTLSLGGGRFLAALTWSTGQGASGRGRTTALTRDTGYAWFFQPANVEALLKVLDGCGVNDRFWVFAAGLTDVRTDITVADTRTGEVRLYHNPPGRPFQPIQDTAAFAGCD